ncbi:endolysin [Microbacterium phage Jemerald]|nr:endolysin [Microbacterium phage Juicer]WNO27263.1 endolysin [Microbacterium phage Jemerald]
MAFTYTGEKVDLGFGRGWISRPAAESIRRIDRQLGHPLQITEAGRTWDQQNKHYQHYLRYGSPIALNPNTPSEHQKGLSIDSDEAQRHQQLMEDNGWRRTVYRWVNGKWTLVERWHYEYFAHLDKRINDNPTPARPKSNEEDNIMLMLEIKAGRSGTHQVALGDKVFRHFIQSDSPNRIKDIERSADDWQQIDITELPRFLWTHGCDLSIWDFRDANGKSITMDTPGAQFCVLNPLDGSVRPGNMWSAENANRAERARAEVEAKKRDDAAKARDEELKKQLAAVQGQLAALLSK